ncbi:MAG: hypothetical protein MUC94_04430 [bacterium]|jgi:hypothetical protein|nr:hypothetical protein [bacterium]
MGKTTLNRQLLCYSVIFIVMLLITISTIASEKPLLAPEKPEMQQKQDDTKSDAPKITDDAMKLFLKEMVFYGQIAKPQAVFIIPGTDPRVDGLKIDRHFFSHIFRPVERSTLRNVRDKQGNDKDHILW